MTSYKSEGFITNSDKTSSILGRTRYFHFSNYNFSNERHARRKGCKWNSLQMKGKTPFPNAEKINNIIVEVNFIQTKQS